ncbi:MAG: amino acid adenylation domain-containing protein, partial [Cyanobacteria bacterium J06627_8]
LELKFDFEKTLGSSLPITSLLKSQNIAALSAEILQDFSNETLSKDFGAAFPQLTPDPDNRHLPFPLNDIQEAYWLGRSGLFEIGNVAAHVYAEFETESLDYDRLNDAFRHLINRHDMLRAVILPNGQQQILELVPPYNIERLDLQQALPAEIEHQLSTLRQRLSHQIHDAHQWPLFTVCAARLSGERIRLYLSFDNLLVDGASLGLLCWEWGQIYQGLGASLAPLTASFRDYVLALKAFEQSAVYQRSLAYWKERIPQLPRAPELPLAIAPATLQQPRFIRRTAQIEPETWQRLQQQATRASLTPSGLLVAVYAEVLATWSKTRRFSLNLTTFNRLPIHPEVQNIVGDFTSLTLLAVNYHDPGSFWKRAKQLQTQLWQDLEHSYVSGVRVLRELARAAESAARVTMPVVFTSLLANPQLKGRSAFSTDWLGQLAYGIAQTPQVWLDHQVYEEAGALVLNWDYVQALFPEGMADDMFDTYVQGLRTLATQPVTGEQDCFLQLPDRQRDLQVDFNATVTDVSDACLQTLFLIQAQRQPQHPAVVSETRTLTYAELLLQSQQLSQQLRHLGVKPRQLVAIAMDKGWEQVVAVLGVLMAGAAYVPVDPALPEERRWYLLEQSLAPGQQAIVLTQSWLLDTIRWPTQAQALPVDATPFPPIMEPIEPPSQSTDLAYVIYTSGSTGLPKGVMIDHRGAVNTILDINRRWRVGPSDRVFALSSLSFDLSVYDIFGTLSAGATIVIPPAAAAKEPALWVEVLQREEVTLWNSVPALMQMLVTYAAERPGIVPPSLRLVLLSGDWLPLALPDRIRTLVPNAQVVSLGGATEASIWSIFYPIDAVDPDWKSIPYGRPLANQQFYILDMNLEPCPVWAPGQLYIGGLGLAQGYWHDEAKTAASFITHPSFGSLYRTGDMGRFLPNGQLEFLGREDNQVKLSGYRIELGEIESTLTRHPDVSQAVVLAAGEPAQQLVAYVCLEDETEQVNPEPPDNTQATSSSAIASTARVASYQQEPADGVVRWQALVSEAVAQAKQIAEPVDWDAFQRLWQHLHDLYGVAAGIALRQIGGFTQPGVRQSLETIQQKSQIHPRYRPWLKRALTYLSEKGYLHCEAGEYIQHLSLPDKLPAELVRQVSTEAPQAIGLNVEATSLIINSVERIADILTENFHSAEIYTAEEVPEIYQKQFYTSNLVMQRAMDALLQHWKPEGPLQMLEVGAGIGSTTAQILPMLPGDRTTYVYTDISNYFLQYAQQHFGAYSFLETRLLDIEQHPQTQDYELHSFDVVVAVSVLHATRDIAETLAHIALLLKPGGVLLMLEETKFYAPFDLTMGLQQGFDRFEDTGLRQHHPLLSRDEWRRSILEAGFTGFQVVAQQNTIAEQLGFDVLIARGPTTVQSFDAQALKTYLEQKLPTYMIPQDYAVLDAIPLTSNGKIDRRSLQTLWQLESPTTSEYVAPQNAIQEILVAMWQELLGCDRVGIQDNFFGLGGDSLIAAQVMTRVRENFQVEVSLRQLFQEPTVAQLAEAIAQALAEHIDPELLKDLETM